MAALPAKRSCFFSLNGDALAKIIDASPGRKVINSAPLQGLSVVGSMVEDEHSERIDIFGAGGSATLRQQLKTLKGVLTPVDDTALAQLPPGARVTLLSSNPGQWATFLQQILLGFATDPDKKDIDKGFTQVQPVLAILNACAGPFGAAGSWTKEQGGGVAVVGKTSTAMEAKIQVTLLSDFINTQANTPIAVADEVVSLPEIPLDDLFHLKPCWMAKDSWFKFASAPEWIHGPGALVATLPPEALGADCVIRADWGFINTFREQLEANMVLGALTGLVGDNGEDNQEYEDTDFPTGGIMVTETLRLLGLDQLQMLGYSRIADDGAAWHGVLDLGNANSMMSLLRLSPMVAVALAPAVSIPASEKALQTRSLSNLRQLALATQMYAQDNEEMLPTWKTPDDLKAELNIADKIWTQPLSNLPYQPNPLVAGKALGDFADPEDVILFYEQTPYADGGRCAAFLDGHVQYMSAQVWEAAKAGVGIK
jgi:hypothetical protein